MAREDGIWLQDWDSGDNLKINNDGSVNVRVSVLPDNDAFLKSFVAVYPGSVGTTETDTVLITNPVSSGKLLYLTGMSVSPVTNGRIFTPRVYINPSITANGTLLTRSSVQVTYPAPSSVMTLYSLPTISSRGTLLKIFSSGQFQDTSNLITQNSLVVFAGYSILITNAASSTNSEYGLNLSWSEI